MPPRQLPAHPPLAMKPWLWLRTLAVMSSLSIPPQVAEITLPPPGAGPAPSAPR